MILKKSFTLLTITLTLFDSCDVTGKDDGGELKLNKTSIMKIPVKMTIKIENGEKIRIFEHVEVSKERFTKVMVSIIIPGIESKE